MDIPSRASDAGPNTSHPRFKSQEEQDEYREARRQAEEASWPQCGNCWKHSEELVYVPGYDYMGCAECALEAVTLDAVELSEWFCPERFVTVQKADTVYGLVELLNAHNAGCVACGSGLRRRTPEMAAAADAAENGDCRSTQEVA